MVQCELVQSLQSLYHDLYCSYFGKVHKDAPSTAVAANANHFFM